MSATIHIEADPDRDLIRIKLAGFFTPADVETFLALRRKAHARLRCGPNQHLTLNDISAMKIQPQETVAAFRDVLAAREFHSRKLAFLVGPTLARAQVIRALEGRDARCFSDLVIAEAWLFDQFGTEAPAD